MDRTISLRTLFRSLICLVALVLIVSTPGTIAARAGTTTQPALFTAGAPHDALTPAQMPDNSDRQSRQADGPMSVLASPTNWDIFAGAAFTPGNSGIGYTYLARGCITPSTTGEWNTNLHLPNGAVIKEVWFAFYNSAASAASYMYILRFNVDTGAETVVSYFVTDPGSAATGFRAKHVTLATPHTVDNYMNSYTIHWQGPTSNTTLQDLCYFQVGYTPPFPYMAALPAVLK